MRVIGFDRWPRAAVDDGTRRTRRGRNVAANPGCEDCATGEGEEAEGRENEQDGHLPQCAWVRHPGVLDWLCQRLESICGGARREHAGTNCRATDRFPSAADDGAC